MKKELPCLGNLNEAYKRSRKHAVTEDASRSGRARLSCACGANLVRQDWMSQTDWTLAMGAFNERHQNVSKK